MPESIRELTLSKKNLDSLRAMVPGDVIDLQITTPTSPKRVKVHYVGMDTPNCLIFQMPTSAKWISVRDLLPPGNDLVVRHVIEGDAGQVIAFRVKVLKLLVKPCGLLLTTFPDSMQAISLRSEKCAQPGVAVVVKSEKFDDDSEDATGIIVDISSNGCRVTLPLSEDLQELNEDDKLTLAYVSDGESLDIKAKIKNKRKESESISYGLQFAGDQDAVKQLLKRHVLFESE